ncbi:MAG: ECF-type sigma factor [Acidobacteriota bacterium]
MSRGTGDLTRLLRQWSDGDERVLDALMERTYAELRRIARAHFRRERGDHTLQPTALVNELFMKLTDVAGVSFRDRAHFYSIASRIMRRLLIDHARMHDAGKRRGARVTLHDDMAVVDASCDTAALAAALEKLEGRYPRESRVVELRYLCGLTNEEAASVLDVSLATVKRDWKFARSWLLCELGHEAPRGHRAR